MDNNKKSVAVLVPCYNEEKTVKKVCEDFMKALPEATIYVYDNNSTDKTYEIASSLGERVVVRKEYRQGKGNVVRSMFRQIDADCYIMIDGDDTYPSEHAREMVDLVLNENYDMVIGDRLSSTYFQENKRRFHGFGNKLVRSLINGLFKSDIKDIMTGYRAFSYDFVKMMPIVSGGFEIETEMTINALDKKFNIKEIPINFRDRPEGSVSKLNTFSDGMKVLKTIAIMFKEYRPLMFFGTIAVVFLLLAAVLFAPVFAEYLNTHLVPRFPTLIFASGCAVVGVISLAIGVILDVLVKKNKQDFIVKLNILSSQNRKLK
jgi:glycosyltransferase involved in cell wall biosynthesis